MVADVIAALRKKLLVRHLDQRRLKSSAKEISANCVTGYLFRNYYVTNSCLCKFVTAAAGNNQLRLATSGCNQNISVRRGHRTIELQASRLVLRYRAWHGADEPRQ
jgi:hypothetical protein